MIKTCLLVGVVCGVIRSAKWLVTGAFALRKNGLFVGRREHNWTFIVVLCVVRNGVFLPPIEPLGLRENCRIARA